MGAPASGELLQKAADVQYAVRCRVLPQQNRPYYHAHVVSEHVFKTICRVHCASCVHPIKTKLVLDMDEPEQR